MLSDVTTPGIKGYRRKNWSHGWKCTVSFTVKLNKFLCCLSQAFQVVCHNGHFLSVPMPDPLVRKVAFYMKLRPYNVKRQEIYQYVMTFA